MILVVNYLFTTTARGLMLAYLVSVDLILLDIQVVLVLLQVTQVVLVWDLPVVGVPTEHQLIEDIQVVPVVIVLLRVILVVLV